MLSTILQDNTLVEKVFTRERGTPGDGDYSALDLRHVSRVNGKADLDFHIRAPYHWRTGQRVHWHAAVRHGVGKRDARRCDCSGRQRPVSHRAYPSGEYPL